ncbi:MAG TPA: hypothetical protein VJM57_05330 [Thermodesulfobacteriota bacterium]|nr:hypothetical protein [Thermodesulfobacteriota bacterium]HLE19336.1 hypothetical protein [Syntrophales bacterium]
MENKAAKSDSKNRVVLVVLFFGTFFFLVFADCYGGEKQKSVDTGKELLVAKDIYEARPIWCGQGVLIYTIRKNGVYWYNIETGRKAKVAEPGSTPLACTPDGEWLVYIDKNSLRHDDGTIEREVIDVWRYEFKTERRQQFAIADYGEASSIGDGVLAPKGRRVFLGKQPKARVKMPSPEWDIIWTQEKAGLTAWLHDSTAIVRVYSGEGKDRLFIRVFSPEKNIFLEQRAKYILRLLTDKQDNVYMQVSNEEFEPDLINEVIRCTVDLKEEKISCVPVLEDFSIKGFDVFPSGEAFVFMEWRVEGCVKIARVENSEASCIAKGLYHPGYYLSVSPDDKWLAFVVLSEKEGDVFTNDLYLIKLKN